MRDIGSLTATRRFILVAVMLSLATGLMARMYHIEERDVRVQLNLLKLRWTDDARQAMNSDDPLSDTGGAFAWQHRILVPIVVTVANGIISSIDSRDDLRSLRVFYALLLGAALLGIFWAVGQYAEWMFCEMTGTPRSRPSADFALMAMLWTAIFLLLGVHGSPTLKVAPDYLQLPLLFGALVYTLQKRHAPLIVLIAILTLIRETAVFIAVIYLFVHWRSSDADDPRGGTLALNRDVIRWAGTLAAVVIALTVAVRAFFLGGIRYVIDPAYAQLADHWQYAVTNWTVAIPSVLFVALLVSGSALSYPTAPVFIRRLTAAGIVLLIPTWLIGYFNETRIHYPILAFLIVPFVLGVGRASAHSPEASPTIAETVR